VSVRVDYCGWVTQVRRLSPGAEEELYILTPAEDRSTIKSVLDPTPW
jgi:hypothetical protein